MARKYPSFLVDFGRTDEGKLLFENLDIYRRSLGWSWKRMYLMGMAHVIEKNNDNPDLIVSIADYLGRR